MVIVLSILVGSLAFISFALILYILVVANKRTEEALQRSKQNKIDWEDLNEFFNEERKDDTNV